MPIVLVALAVVTSGQSLKSSKNQVFETESAYNYIQVQQDGDLTILRLNDGEGVHSIYSPTRLDFGGPWEQFLVGPYFYRGAEPSEVKRMAIVGLAAGTAAHQATAVYGPIPIDGFELDPTIIEVGRVYFDEDLTNLNVIIGDGRWNLEQSPHRYDIIAVDAYRPPYIPPHMTTREFYEICAAHLTETGVLGINVCRGRAADADPAEEIESIKSQIADSEYTERPKVSFDVGETVKINDGPFLNFSGVIEEIEPERGKLKVTVNIFGGNTPVELEYWQVEKG